MLQATNWLDGLLDDFCRGKGLRRHVEETGDGEMTTAELRESARAIWEAALAAAKPDMCVRKAVQVIDDGFRVGDTLVEVLGGSL